MDLRLLWFVLIAILFTGFFVLEGFDFGIGILLPFLGKSDSERRMIYNAIGPFWDGNEVWLITTGGAIFAAFPSLYASLFSSFYLEMFAILFALILRGAAFEFRSRRESPGWRTFWDWMMFVGSLLPSFFWGVIISNLLRGIPIDASMNYVGGIWNLLNPHALLYGILFVLAQRSEAERVSILRRMHGAVFLDLRVTGVLRERARRIAQQLSFLALIMTVLFLVWSFFVSPTIHSAFTSPQIAPLSFLSLITIIAVPVLLVKKQSGWAFAMTSLTIILTAASIGLGLFPRVIISSLNPAWNLSIANASSSPYTLTVISWLALTLLPFVLAFEGWSYWVFHKRLDPRVKGHY
jgi:cytochrome d ubiquinol oxidase subunit II